MTPIDRPLAYEVINLERGKAVLLSGFVRLIEEITGLKAQLVPALIHASDTHYSHADISKARPLLDYNSIVPVLEGVIRFLEWYERAVLGRGEHE